MAIFSFFCSNEIILNKKEEEAPERRNIFASDEAVGCRYSCKGELVAWEVAPRVTIEKR